MRHLPAHLSCKRLKRKGNNQPETDIKAKKAWRRFNKQNTKKACYKLQQGLCAYTELSLDNELLGNHLEHIAPRSRFPERTFFADNLVLSILGNTYAGSLDEPNRFAGHYKQSRYCDDWFISPYHSDCESYFHYCPHTGIIYPENGISQASQKKATLTIAALNLNCDFLVLRRRQQLTTLDGNIQLFLTELSAPRSRERTRQALVHLAEEVLQTNSNQLPEFYSAKKQLFIKYIAAHTA